jgi:Ferritin-like domain
VTESITRAHLLSRSLKSGATLLVAGSALGEFTAAAAADAPPPTDLAYARLLVGAELLASDFYSQAIAASNTGKAVTWSLKRAYLNEQEHYQSLAGFVSGTGNTPAIASDITFSYPAGTFATQRSILAFGQQLEETILGAYLGAAVAVQTQSLATAVCRILACEAQHVSYLATATGGKPFLLSFPPMLTIDQASDAFDAYTS